MIRNYFKIAFRNLSRYKGFSFINITGLAIGIACCILILLWVRDELSYNQFFDKSDQIFRINKKYQMGNETSYNPSTPYPLAQAVKEGYANVLETTKFHRTSALIKYEDNIFNERRVCVTDPSFFKIFTFQFRKGDPEKALVDQNSIVITENVAEKYFGEINPIGKTLTVDNRKEMTVSGVIQNIPANSSIRYEIFVPTKSMDNPDFYDDWGSHWLRTYVLLQKETDLKEFEQNLSGMIKEHLPEEKISLVLQPLNQLHLYTIEGKSAGMKYVYFFSAIAFFILTIACINFINLSTARLEKRAKEVGLRKVVGAERSQIVKQFFGESIIFALVALIFSLILIEIFEPVFNTVTGKNLTISYFNSTFILSFVGIAIFTGLVSGSYPALYLSSFQPVKVLKRINSQKHNTKSFTKVLVLIQFSLSIMLLIATGIIYNQLQYMQQKDLGFNQENILYVNMNRDLRENFDVFKNELLKNQNILNVARASEPPTETWSIMRGIKWEGKETDEGAAFGFAAIDYDYIKTMNIKISQGRDFSKSFSTDTMNYIFNECAIKVIGMEQPIGKQFGVDSDTKGTVVGVVKDFHFLPLTYAMEPLMLMIMPDFYRLVLVKVRPENINETINYAESIWNKIVPNYPFEYHFLDEEFDITYRDEIRAENLFKYFVSIAIIISCLGLLGLASFTAEQKTKEIGIRKVMGASVSQIIVMLSTEFTKWVLIANIIAWPVAWYAMSKWLENFAYRIDIDLWTFLFAGVTALAIALLTISYQAIKAAIANPIEALRYE